MPPPVPPQTPQPYDTALVRTLPVNSRFRVLVETNRYSAPSHLAGAVLTVKIVDPHTSGELAFPLSP